MHTNVAAATSLATLERAWTEWLEAADEGPIRNRSGDRYKPSVLVSYRQTMRRRVLASLGSYRIAEITRRDVQDLADELLAEGLDPSTIRNTVMPLRVLFGRLVNRGELLLNPAAGLALPAVRGKRDRVVAPEEAARLLGRSQRVSGRCTQRPSTPACAVVS